MIQHRLSRIVAIAVLAVAMSIATAAQAGQQPAATEIGTAKTFASVPTPDRWIRDLTRALPALGVLKQTSADRQLWAQSLAQAQARHRRSTWILISGAGAIGLGAVVQAGQRDGYTYINGTGFGTPTLLYLIGGGVGVYGFMERTRSRHDIDLLEAEGRQRGFMVSVNPNGLRATWTLTF